MARGARAGDLPPRGGALAHDHAVRARAQAVTAWSEQVGHPNERVEKSLRRHRRLDASPHRSRKRVDWCACSTRLLHHLLHRSAEHTCTCSTDGIACRRVIAAA
jgi:hypothetical protein